MPLPTPSCYKYLFQTHFHSLSSYTHKNTHFQFNSKMYSSPSIEKFAHQGNEVPQYEEEIPLFCVIEYGVSENDFKTLLNAGIKTCDDLLKFTKKDMTDKLGLTDAAKVDKIFDAAEMIVRECRRSPSEVFIKKVICDEDFVTNLLDQPEDRVIKKLEKVLSAEVKPAVTTCTASSLLKANRVSPDYFLTERCGHDPPISSIDCSLLTAKESKFHIATGSEEHLAKLTFDPSVPVVYGSTVNNIGLLPLLTESKITEEGKEAFHMFSSMNEKEMSFDEEMVRPKKKNKKDISFDEEMVGPKKKNKSAKSGSGRGGKFA